ncbi:three-helix bundle dimerization domain-containing protein [Schumannella soli]|uniref:DUF3562 domain-containing protein n=1 Tax=Schumannella soli TaxID=2590779 RepID=A0A506XYQ2_9MICO|nr:hypothetical protein [Schumannella soli]TPW77881.1 hypothetical protein FJ657_04345 [Schumannella soli]
MTTEFNRDEAIRQVTEGLRKKFPDHSDEQLRSVATEEVDRLATKPVTDYVIVLGERAARKRLKAD